MQRRTKLSIALGAAGLIGLAAVADTAFADRSRGHHGWHGGGGHHGGSMHHMRGFFERYDTNNDGRITQEEIDANRAQWHGEFDGDNNGQLSLQEFQALWLKARFESMVREFQQFDRNGDGQVTLEEYQEPLTEMVERLDRNDDGALSRDDRGRRGKQNRSGSDSPGGEQSQEQPQQQQQQQQQ